MNNYVDKIFKKYSEKYSGEKEYLNTLKEILNSFSYLCSKYDFIEKNNVIERFIEPDRIIEFKVPWVDDNGNYRVNKGYRVQFNNAIGPYKGGLRFHPSVNVSILKFLGLEQCVKNSLTTLQMGGAKGGSDFDPKNKSDNEIMHFCNSFMNELYKYIGPNIDVPAGDIGVGKREIGYLFGQYKRITNKFNGVLTGKSLEFGGSLIRPEATGYGLCYFVAEALKSIDWKRYGLKDLDNTPLTLFVNLISTQVPYLSTGKQSISPEPEIVHEIRQSTMKLARKLQKHLRSKKAAKEKAMRSKVFEDLLPVIIEESAKLGETSVPEYTQVLAKVTKRALAELLGEKVEEEEVEEEEDALIMEELDEFGYAVDEENSSLNSSKDFDDLEIDEEE